MGLYHRRLFRQVTVMRLVWDHIFPGFLVTVVHVSAYFRARRSPLFGNEVVGPSGPEYHAAEFHPFRLAIWVSLDLFIPQLPSGGGGRDRSGLIQPGLTNRGFVGIGPCIVPSDRRISA